MKDLILKHSLINAIEHNGRANVQAVLGKVIGEKPELRIKIREIVLDIQKIVREVNSLSPEEQKKKFDELGIVVEKKENIAGLPELPNAVEGRVVMRAAPFHQDFCT